jgi:hypothetical protein
MGSALLHGEASQPVLTKRLHLRCGFGAATRTGARALLSTLGGAAGGTTTMCAPGAAARGSGAVASTTGTLSPIDPASAEAVGAAGATAELRSVPRVSARASTTPATTQASSALATRR